MIKADSQRQVASGTKRLADAVRAAKIATAQRTDVVVDIREADRARLEMFAEELQPIVDAVPGDDDLFDFTLSGGPQLRFWIDGTAHVLMARDRRTYRFVRDTRLGRVTLAESTEVRAVVDQVTEYIAERMVERDRAYALTDEMSHRLAGRMASPGEESQEPLRAASLQRTASPSAIAICALVAGVAIGVAALLVLASLRGVSLV